VPVTAKAKGSLVEVFSSCQGEGPLVGCRQIFIRFSGCNLECHYCDTDWQLRDSCRLEKEPGCQEFEELPNPISLETVTQTLNRWLVATPGLHHSISLTGGEPLCHTPVLAEWLPELSSILPVYLETNGTLPEALTGLLDWISWVSMDIKLPSMTGHKPFWDEHRQFLETCREAQVETVVKVVCSENSPLAELEEAARLVAQAYPQAVFVLQPVSSSEHRPPLAWLFKVQEHLATIHEDVRVIPQVHVLLNIP